MRRGGRCSWRFVRLRALSEPIVERTRGAGGVASDLRKIVDGIRWVLQRELDGALMVFAACWRRVGPK